MKRGFYEKLAFTGIKKNKKLYTPYILTCIGMVMMTYIISFLASSDTLRNMRGGTEIQGFLGLGFGVMSVFSLIFLFYTNSFLLRRRKKEFGLYNILGMGKKNLAVVLMWESLFIAGISIVCGIFSGIVFSKLAELCLIKILQGTAEFGMTVKFSSIWQTALLFAGIFLLIFINTLRQIHLTNPIELLHSENAGEKPPKANWILALAGAVILGGAYYLAVSIEDPMSALTWFFVAVVMVIIATYLLFVAGSVVLCKILQKNKKYYYKTNHFVSVSSMIYRMKRNGAGLASICILCTMVLVMVSSTVCLFTGTEDSLRTRYPRHINIQANVTEYDEIGPERLDEIRSVTSEETAKLGAEPKNVLDYRVAALAGYDVADGVIDVDNINNFTELSDVWQIFIVPIEDYNRLMGKNVTLAEDEVLIYTTKMGKYENSTVAIGDGEPLKVKEKVTDFVNNGVDAMQVFPSMCIFVSDFNEKIEPLKEYKNNKGDQIVQYSWFYAYDLDLDDETQIELLKTLKKEMLAIQKQTVSETGDEDFYIVCEGVSEERAGFYGLYGGLFFLGILLGIVFIFAAVLIIYYKQVSEGYEDQSRFDIMQKVGMTKKEIRKSINSQILTVFFLPLVTAGMHLAFAFPLIKKLLLLFNLTNTSLLIGVTVACYLIFALFYVIVYRLTSGAYYSIVSGAREDAE